MTLRFFPFLLLAVPLAEIACFIVVGQLVGVLPTIGLVVLTTIIGSILLRIQGFGILQKLTQESQDGKNPAKDLVHGAMIAVAGLLLIVPGFITDTIGFLLFIPPIRALMWQFLRSRVTVVSTASRFTRSYSDPHSQRPSEVDAKIVDLGDDEYKRGPDPKSPWNAP